MLDFAKCERLVSTARDKRSKPVANNTRLEKRDEDTYALRLHATDIATFHRDGRIILNSGGWRTVTTADRLRGFVTRHLSSERGVWYIGAAPDPNDPEPERGWKLDEIPKPFEALDPGPEPEWSENGCQAGTETLREFDEDVLVSRRELEDPNLPEATEESIVRPYGHDSDYFVGYRVRHVKEWTHWGREQWARFVEQPTLAINERWKYEQCPHCKLFDAQHEAWSLAMNGERWGRNKHRGYSQMTKMLERFGSREAWREAYLENFRARRTANKAWREWLDRSRVPFEDGMEIDAEGYAPRPDLKAIAREQRRQKKIAKKRERINKYVAEFVRELTTNGMPMPSGGDCWYCSFYDEDGRTWGDLTDADHLKEHMREPYYVPSLVVNALREAGYRDTGVYLMLAMDPDANRMGGPRENGHLTVHEDAVTRALRRYLYKRLIPEAYGEQSIPPMVGSAGRS